MFDARVEISCDECGECETIDLDEALTDTDIQLCFIANPPDGWIIEHGMTFCMECHCKTIDELSGE
jgi:hypothetical protein